MLLSGVTVFVCGLVACSAAPSSILESNDIPKLHLSGGGASASFGGYHASAGLGGSLQGGPAGGLFAQAGTPDGTSAAAGLAGSVGSGGFLASQAQLGSGADSTAKASAGTANQVPPPNGRPDDFYDNVFNIPISVLQAVNQLLGGTPRNGGTRVVQSRVDSTDSAVTSAQAGADVYVSKPVSGRTFFDDIFNIPISALTSVNDLLNSKNRVQKSPVHY